MPRPQLPTPPGPERKPSFHTYLAFRDRVDIRRKKPQNRHLRVFGCKAYAPYPYTLNKFNMLMALDPRARIGYFVGYNSTMEFRG